MQMYCTLSAQCKVYSPYRVLRLEAEEETGGEVLNVVHTLHVPSGQQARVRQVTYMLSVSFSINNYFRVF